MKTLRSTVNILIFLLLSSTFLGFSRNNLSAQSNTSVTIGIAPQSEYIKLNPGESFTTEFAAWNKSSEERDFYIYVSGFKQLEDFPGTSIPLTIEEDNKAAFSASKWISVSSLKITLPPAETEQIGYTITVPAGTPHGTYNAKIFLSTRNRADDNLTNQTITDLAAGPALLITVGDNLIESLEFQAISPATLSFYTDKFLYETPEVLFTTTLHNTGNTYLTPTGEIIINNMFGQEVTRLPFNESGRSLLRDNLGSYNEKWKNEKQIYDDGIWLFGKMSAKLIVTYTVEDPGFSALSATTSFWVLPWKLILIVLLTIFTIARVFKYLSENLDVSIKKKKR